MELRSKLRRMRNSRGIQVAALLVFAAAARKASAEVTEIRAAKQYGLSYLALMIMQDGKLVGRHAKAKGLGELRTTWAQLGGPGAMDDAIRSAGLAWATGEEP